MSALSDWWDKLLKAQTPPEKIQELKISLPESWIEDSIKNWVPFGLKVLPPPQPYPGKTWNVTQQEEYALRKALNTVPLPTGYIVPIDNEALWMWKPTHVVPDTTPSQMIKTKEALFRLGALTLPDGRKSCYWVAHWKDGSGWVADPRLFASTSDAFTFSVTGSHALVMDNINHMKTSMWGPVYGHGLCSCGCGAEQSVINNAYQELTAYYVNSASGGSAMATVVSGLSKAIPALNEALMHCPEVDCDEPEWVDILRKVIVHLNDAHRWTREQIADWLETLDVDLRFPDPVDQDVA